MRAVPARFWPAIGLAALWILAPICNEFSGEIDVFGAYCARVADPLTFVIVPFTIISGFIPHRTKRAEVLETARLTTRSMVKRVVVAAILTLATLGLWPRPLVSYIYFNEANLIHHFFRDGILDFLDAGVKASIPRGEIELRELPEALAHQLLLGSVRERGTDGWGHPYMFVAEDRADRLWIGIYSVGQDGISNSKGNDPDDQNSWGQDGMDYYQRKIQRWVLVRLLVEGGIAFAFYLPICLMTFRRPKSTTQTEPVVSGQAPTRSESE